MRAVSRPVDLTPDLTDVARGDGVLFVRDGVGVAGRGTAARLAADDAADLLAAVDHVVESDSEPGPGVGPVAVGWVPYEPGGRGEMVVPASGYERTVLPSTSTNSSGEAPTNPSTEKR